MKKSKVNGMVILLFLTVVLNGCSMKNESGPSANLAADADRNAKMQDTRNEEQVETQDDPEISYETDPEQFSETDTKISTTPALS